jgi:hypothetical protein
MRQVQQVVSPDEKPSVTSSLHIEEKSDKFRSEKKFEYEIEVGDVVKLSLDFAKYSDAAFGPLGPNDEGQVVEAGDKRNLVLAKGKRWWYDKEALVIVEPDDNESDTGQFKEQLDLDSAIQLLASPAAIFTTDFRLKCKTENITEHAGPEGTPKYLMETNQSSFLSVPKGAFLGCNFSRMSRTEVEHRISCFTIIMDVRVDHDKLATDGACLVSFQWPIRNDDKNVGRIVITKEGIVRTSLHDFHESANRTAKLRSNHWHRILVSRNPQERRMTIFVDGKFYMIAEFD